MFFLVKCWEIGFTLSALFYGLFEMFTFSAKMLKEELPSHSIDWVVSLTVTILLKLSFVVAGLIPLFTVLWWQLSLKLLPVAISICCYFQCIHFFITWKERWKLDKLVLNSLRISWMNIVQFTSSCCSIMCWQKTNSWQFCSINYRLVCVCGLTSSKYSKKHPNCGFLILIL